MRANGSSFGLPFFVSQKITDIHHVLLVHRDIDERHVRAVPDHLTRKRQVAQLPRPEGRGGRAHLPFGRELHVHQLQLAAARLAGTFQRHAGKTQIGLLVLCRDEAVDELRGQDLKVRRLVLGRQMRMEVIGMVMVVMMVRMIMGYWTSASLRTRHGEWSRACRCALYGRPFCPPRPWSPERPRSPACP